MPNGGNKTEIMGGNILPEWLDKGKLTICTAFAFLVVLHQDI